MWTSTRGEYSPRVLAANVRREYSRQCEIGLRLSSIPDAAITAAFNTEFSVCTAVSKCSTQTDFYCNKVSYCKQIMHRHSCHKYFGQGRDVVGHCRPCIFSSHLVWSSNIWFMCMSLYRYTIHGSPKNCGCWSTHAWGGGVANPLETCPFPYVTLPNFVVLIKRYEHIRRKKIGPMHPTFQGHSRSSEPTRIHQLLMTSYKWSTVTVGRSHNSFETNGIFNCKWQIYPMYLMPNWWDSPGITTCAHTYSGADMWNYLSKYDTSTKLGTNTPWGLLFLEKYAGHHKFKMAAIFQDGRHSGI